MAKSKVKFVCSDCGHEQPRWSGQCPQCKAWNTISEFKVSASENTPAGKHRAQRAGYAGETDGKVKRVSEVVASDNERLKLSKGEFNRVLGGGVTIGSANLLSGDPGAGKTTLLTETICEISLTQKVLYATSEESLAQFKNRMERLGCKYDDTNLFLLAETDVDSIIEKAIEVKARVVVVDSIQTVSGDYTGAPGSVGQVKGCAHQLTMFGKSNDVTFFIVGHVTKGSDVAGPQTLRHIVDGTFHIEVADNDLRLLRTTKNRFGEADAVGIFRMTEKGMASIDNPSKIFLSRMIEDGPGSAITCIRDGNRQLLVEIQSLVTATDSDFAQRVSMGVNMNRLKILAAILKKHGRMSMNNDIYLSVIGGLKINEMDSSADLAIAASLYSSYKEKAIDSDTCMLGELSLAGEVRPISNGVQRVQEAVKHGFKTIYIPKSNYHPKMESDGVDIVQLVRVKEFLDRAFG